MYSVTNHPRFSELWNAKANAYNALTEVLVNNGLEEEISKVIALQHAQIELYGMYEEVAFDNGVLNTVNHIKGILREKNTLKMEEAK